MRRGRTVPVRVVFLAGGIAAAALVGCSTGGSAEERLGVTRSALAVEDALVIAQLWGGGGNSGAPYTYDYVELFNRGASDVSLAGASLQYASTSGSTWTNVVALPAATVPAGGHFLVQLAAGSGTPGDLPITADLVATVNLGATGGKVLLSTGATGVACAAACAGAATVVDLVGYGTANDAEGAAAPAASNTTALLRKAGGCQDTGHNDADFVTGAPGSLHNAASAPTPCAASDAGSDGGDAGDAGATGDAGSDATVDGGDDAGADAGDDAGDASVKDAAVDGAPDAAVPAAKRDAGGGGNADDWVPQPDASVGEGCVAAPGGTASGVAGPGLVLVALALGSRRRRRGR